MHILIASAAENDIEPYSPLHLRHMSLEEVTITPRNRKLLTQYCIFSTNHEKMANINNEHNLSAVM